MAVDVEREVTLIFINTSVQIAATTILYCDYFETIEREVALIWQTKLSVGKVLFLTTRYCSYSGISIALYLDRGMKVPLSRCEALYHVYLAFSIASSEGILAMTVHALLSGGQRRRVVRVARVALLVFISTCITTALVLVNIYVAKGFKTIPPTWWEPRCRWQDTHSIYLYACYYILFILEFFLATTALTLGLRKYRRSRSPLLTVIYRDGGAYYLILMALTAANILFTKLIDGVFLSE
ncbi:hypothetical protein CC1G_14918 [Coprinopsis cinerea okayama7|uniref:DUF6533 domain-containing protein n=1 Tax=Coprinopsis cinerea (strain Okayama-7 / 130 / ATCC MYA-4618 / FGSC 9003) TaxID=240176 RepID=D6RNY3_COPC7|nr:hypothetical protein CC1G_14918 [Coprinopsis cinerea okayama7\|eukprot:XP_002910940.1 hypothetical protein CC1G_14918 [Coprinopsis cinerea okayama7\